MKDDTRETPEQNARRRGYQAAAAWNQNHTTVAELRQYGATDTLPGPFRDGWMQYCDEREKKEQQFAESDRAYRREVVKNRTVNVLGWILLAVVLALAGIMGWAYYLRWEAAEAEQQRRADLADRTRWLGSVKTSRYWYADGDFPGRPTHSTTINNIEVEIGLRADGTVIWRKAGPTPKAK